MLDLLRRLGVFAAPGFLDVATCRDICAEMASTEGEPGLVLSKDAVDAVDLQHKRLHRMELSEARHALVDSRLAAIMPAFAQHFGVALAHSEGAMFYRYRTGDFFTTHRDVYQMAEIDHERRVSIVLFLNDHTDAAGLSYEGGDLVMYDLMDGAGADRGIAVPADAGLLVAFRSDLRHEVTPVTSGVRCVAVDRFY